MNISMTCLLPVLTMTVLTAPAWAQGLAVQQPVVQSFSAATTISVPDGGTAFVGGIGRARQSRASFGPVPFRGGIGQEIARSSLSAGVTIHDFAAMDAALLAAPTHSRGIPETVGAAGRPITKSRYDDATSYAMSRRLDRLRPRDPEPTAISDAHSTDAGSASKSVAPAVANAAARQLALGAAAERAGRPALAAVYYRAALQAGSETAGERLAALPY